MVKVILDSNEASNLKNSSLISFLKKKKEVTEYSEEPLYCGDVIIGNYLIEIKRGKDIFRRDKDGSLSIFNQAKRLKEMSVAIGITPVILIEGKKDKICRPHWGTKYRNSPPAFYKEVKTLKKRFDGITNSLRFDYGIYIKETGDYEETKIWLNSLFKKMENIDVKKLKTLRTTPRKDLDNRELGIYILQGFPGIGAVTSQKLLKAFGTLSRLFTDCFIHEDLMVSILGNKKTKIFYDILFHDHSEVEK